MGVPIAEPYLAQPDQITKLTYDGAGQLVKRERQDGAEPPTLHTEETWTYDGAGRPVMHVDPVGLVTTTTYNDAVAGGAETRTLPGGATETTTHYLDGQIASVTGSAVVHRFYDYGVEGGLRYTEETTGRADALSRVRTYIDALGRTARVEQPGFAGTETTVYTYEDGSGLLRKVTQPGLADTLYEYDNELHQTCRTGLDVNGNGTLDALSDDRITQQTTTYALDGGAWWRKSVTAIYTSPGAYDPQVVETTWVKATDAFSMGGPSEERRIDMRENETTITVERDPEEHLLTRTVTYPGGLWEQTVTRNGLVQWSRSRSGIVTVYLHDGLGRRTGAVDPRRDQPSEVGYNAAGQVTYREDEAGYRTDYVYEPASGGGLAARLDPNEKTAHLAYTPRGERWRIPT